MSVRTRRLLEMKQAGEPIVCVTAYDFPTARLADEADIPVILVGDSLGNAVLGYDSTLPVTLADMLHHSRAVARGARNALVVADMPFMTYQPSTEDAMRNAGRLLQEGGAQAVKLEGGRTVAPTVQRLTESGVPVMGHVGLLPQSVHQTGGYRPQGRTAEQARALLDDALALQEAGAFAVVIESVPGDVAAEVTRRLAVPTIGIGAGAGCDGQIQVLHDILGLSGRTPRHAMRYADLDASILGALRAYRDDVIGRRFPGPEHAPEAEPGAASEAFGEAKSFDAGET